VCCVDAEEKRIFEGKKKRKSLNSCTQLVSSDERSGCGNTQGNGADVRDALGDAANDILIHDA
jgi:hypothetical protein